MNHLNRRSTRQAKILIEGIAKRTLFNPNIPNSNLNLPCLTQIGPPMRFSYEVIATQVGQSKLNLANLGENKVEIMSKRHYGFTCSRKVPFFRPPYHFLKIKSTNILKVLRKHCLPEAPHNQWSTCGSWQPSKASNSTLELLLIDLKQKLEIKLKNFKSILQRN